MRLLIQHQSHYGYSAPAALGPHLVRLRPATHTRARVETYGLRVRPECELRWQQDPAGNHLARITFPKGSRVDALELLVELCVDVQPVNPFDFYVDDRCRKLPFEYPRELRGELGPYLQHDDPALRGGARLDKLLAEVPTGGDTVEHVIALNQAIGRSVRYVIREEAGIWTPEETLGHGRGSCRDSATLLVAALRARGLAARFVSGYLLQLADEGMIPNEPRGMSHDVVDLHAWAEVYLPGGGWIGLDATSGLLCGEGHIPLACTASPAQAAPLEGTADRPADDVRFEIRVGRLGHEPRPTAPYTEGVWAALRAAGDHVDGALADRGVRMTMGGEPTFTSREHPSEPEWNGAALGPTKWTQGLRLALELRRRLAPGGAMLLRQGKHYPGESLPRWAIELLWRRDGEALFRGEPRPAPTEQRVARAEAERLARSIAGWLGVAGGLQPAFEDPWSHIREEAQLPVDVDPMRAALDDPEERRRLARVLQGGLGEPAGWALPIERVGRPRAGERASWATERWSFRRGHLFLIPGDSPIGLRLPLLSLGAAPPLPEPAIPGPPDPRRARTHAAEEAAQLHLATAAMGAGGQRPVRTALCVEARGGHVHVFLPPLPHAEDFLDLLAAIDAAREETGVQPMLEGYPPPPSPLLDHFSLAPDPGVLEVNLPPREDLAAHTWLLDQVFDAALHAGLHAEKYLLDGRMSGSGGGHHLTLGGPSPLESPFLRRPDLLASLITFVQHHPSLSYLFTGLFIGPTSQAPRVDEARHDTLYELEIALARAFEPPLDGAAPPWLVDLLFRHLLVNLTGNTHRTEISLDKLWDPQSPHGRQGLVELRAFEMPPHVRMATAQMTLVRALVAAFAAAPYRAPLRRFGSSLHDRYLLPHYLWRDFEEVLEFLGAHGVPLPAEAYRPFVELRCPLAGRHVAGDVVLELRNALEPWHVLGEELTTSGTARYVDSSLERIEVSARGLQPDRHLVLVNGHVLPLRPTEQRDLQVAGVRFRAWAPPHSLQPHIGVHHPVRFDVIDTWGRRSLGACAYHVWHPEGRAYDTPPLTRFEASARRAQRFTVEGPLPYPVEPRPATPHPDAPCTLDLRRLPIDRPPWWARPPWTEPPPDEPEDGAGGGGVPR